MKEVAYPVGYSVIPIYKEKTVSGNSNLEKGEATLVSYMPSKCYVVGGNRKINSVGNVVSSYDVVPTYVTGRTMIERYFKDNQPEYDMKDKCINSIKTSYLTDNYEDAMEEAKRLNGQLLDNAVYSSSPFDKRFKNEEEYQQVISTFMSSADFLEARTKNIEVNVGDYVKLPKKANKTKIKVLV